MNFFNAWVNCMSVFYLLQVLQRYCIQFMHYFPGWVIVFIFCNTCLLLFLFQYADPVADLLDRWGVFRVRLFRESCVFHRGNYVKDLNKLGRDLQKVIIVDNSPASYIFHPDNAVSILLCTWNTIDGWTCLSYIGQFFLVGSCSFMVWWHVRLRVDGFDSIFWETE